MDETFIININCSSILFDSSGTHYKMFIDTTKVSVVYELVEWIRWIFSVEKCIYLTHENSVIHELEDIRVLSKLKDFKLKICETSFCIHKKPYRNLLNQNLFVNLNDMKVPKYFLEKLNKINEKLVQEKKITGDYLQPTNKDCFLKESKNVNSNRISDEKSCDIQASNSKSDLGQVCNSSFEINCFDNKKNVKKNLLINYENSSDSSNNSFNSINKTKTNYGGDSIVKIHVDSKQTKNLGRTKNSNILNSYGNQRKFIKPFSLGETLLNMREDLQKKNMKGEINKSSSLDGSDVEGIFIKKNAEKLISSETLKNKKRKRIRKRKAKKQEVEKEYLIPEISPKRNFIEKFNIYNEKNIKPNHIRFDEEDEVQPMETDCVGDESEKKNETDEKINELVSFVKPETTNLIEDCQNFSNHLDVSPLESKIENEIVGYEDKVIDLDNGGCVENLQLYNADESFETPTFVQDLNMIESLKEKLKSAVVVNRFY